MLKHVDTTTIADCWACPIEYGDYTGLTEDEITQLKDWLDQYPQATFEWQHEPLFAEDAITGLMSTCLEVKVWIPAK